MENQIKKPKVTTYFIASDKDAYSYGSVEPSQTMTTGLEELEIYENEDAYLKRLDELGIKLDEEEAF